MSDGFQVVGQNPNQPWPDQNALVQALQNQTGSPLPAAKFAGQHAANALGITDAIQALQGGMLPTEAQDFFWKSAIGALPIPGAAVAGRAAQAAERAAPAAARTLGELFPTIRHLGTGAIGRRTAEEQARYIASQGNVDEWRTIFEGAHPDAWQAIEGYLPQAHQAVQALDRANTGQSGLATPYIAKALSSTGRLGGSPRARDLFAQHIAPHMDEEQFAHHYFAGMHSPEMRLRSVSKGEEHPPIDFDGPLYLPLGSKVGTMSRTIWPTKGLAEHAYLNLEDPYQGKGIAKNLLRNQVDLYNKMGLNNVDVDASLSMGGYAWPKYGFIPKSFSEWDTVAHSAKLNLRQIANQIHPDAHNYVNQLLNSGNPKTVWEIADMNTPVIPRHSYEEQMPLGKRLLAGTNYKARLNLKDPETMERFNDYVSKTR